MITLVARLTGATGRAASTFRAWCREFFEDIFEDNGWSATCDVCGRACAKVTDLPTSNACTGTRYIANCTICPDVVELDEKDHCTGFPLHAITNKRLRPAHWREDAGNQRPAEEKT